MVNVSMQKNGSETERNPSLVSQVSSSECIAWLTIFITESVAIITLNILTIIIFIRNRSLRKRSMYLVINLAVADMLVGGFAEVMHLVLFGGGWVCKLWSYDLTYLGIWGDIIFNMTDLFPLASLTNLAAISLERMHATLRPFKHRFIKNRVLGVVITVTWVTAGLFSTVLGLTSRQSLYVSFYYATCSFILLCLFIIFVSYTSIVVKVYCGAHPQHHGAANRERKLTKTLFIVTLVSVIAWLPSIVCSFLYYNTSILTSLPNLVIKRLDATFMILYFANSLVNPILYTIRMPEFRRALVSLFRRQHRQIQVQIPLGVINGNYL